MSVKAHAKPLPKGEVVHRRYRVIETLDDPTAAGAAYLVDDLEDKEVRVARLLHVPPNRQGLEARMQAVRDAVTTVRLEGNPSLPVIVDFFEESKKMWLVTAKPAGVNADAIVAEAQAGRPRPIDLTLALGLARAFQALYDLGQYQALAGVDSRQVYIDDDNQVSVGDLSFGLFLRTGGISYHQRSSVPDPQPAAIAKFGALMYGLVTGKPYKEGEEIDEAHLPSNLRPVVVRALRPSGADGYASLADLVKALEAIPSAAPEEAKAPDPAPQPAEVAPPVPAAAAPVAASRPVETAPEPKSVPAPRPGAARGNFGVLAPGDILQDRYKVIEMMEAPSLWGAMYLVSPTQGTTTNLVARQMNIPPLRQELGERIEAVRKSVALLREDTHASRPPIVDFFEDGQRMWLVSKKVPGTDVETLVKTRKTITKSDWRALVALRLVEAIQSLHDLGQYQALADLSPRKVMLTTDARVFVVGYGLGLFLRPGAVSYHKSNAVPNAEALAIKRFGEVMYGLLTGELYHEGQVIVDADLPEGLGYVVLRALIPSRQDAYKSLEALRSDLQMLQKLVEHEKMDVLLWEDLELAPERPPVWDEIGIPAFLLRTAVVWWEAARDAFMSQTLIARGVQTLLLAVLIGAVARDMYLRRHEPTSYHKSGPAVYLADTRGRIEIWDANEHRMAASLRLDHPAGGFLYSKRTQRLYVSIPAEKAIDAYFPGEASLVGETKVPAGVGRLWHMGASAMALTLAGDGYLSQVNLRTLTALPAITLPETPVDMAWLDGRDALLLAKTGPPRIEAYSKLEERSLDERPLDLEPKVLRITPDTKQAWVGTASGDGVVLVVDTATLQTVERVELGKGHVIDIVFSGNEAYLLLREGELLTVDRTTYKLVGRAVTVGHFPVALVQAMPRELWVPSTEGKMTIFQAETGKSFDVPLDIEPSYAAAVP